MISPEDSILNDLYLNEVSDVQVLASGNVSFLLPDDTIGDKHQKFVIELATKQTLLITHNIDLAPRINGLSTGDAITIFGEYEWNDEGGIIHWTHKDPNGNHIDGYIEHNEIKYE